MRAFNIVDGAPPIKVVLAVLGGGKRASRDEFIHHCAMKAFVLAEGLRMADARVTALNPETDHPQIKLRVGIVATAAPGSPVVGQETLGKAIAAKGGGQMLLDRFQALIGTGNET